MQIIQKQIPRFSKDFKTAEDVRDDNPSSFQQSFNCAKQTPNIEACNKLLCNKPFTS